MINVILEILAEHGVSLAAPISLNNCNITRRYKLERLGFPDIDSLSAIMIAVPYLTEHKERNLSAYAVCRDYHGYFKELFDIVLPKLSATFPNHRFVGFADDSPIDERDAAAIAGLGMIGDNGMLITEKYSSYVFLGEIITDIPTTATPYPIKHCSGCGACKRACPMEKIGGCLSALTQKKGELSPAEEQAILEFGSVWGCDICQEVCPHTQKAISEGTIYTDIEYFKAALLPSLTRSDLDKMTDLEFSRRAYSWRGRAVIGRNLDLIEKTTKADKIEDDLC